jgi:GT2 family glycosyltransferase
MSVVRVVVPAPVGGRPRTDAVLLAGIAVGLRRGGHDVAVVTAPGALRPGVLAALQSAGVGVVPVDDAAPAAPAALAASYRVAQAVVGAGPAALVVAPRAGGLAGAVVQARDGRAPIGAVAVVERSSAPATAPGDPLGLALERFAVDGADAAVVVDDAVAGLAVAPIERPAPEVIDAVAVVATDAGADAWRGALAAVVAAGAWRLRGLEIVVAGVPAGVDPAAALDELVPARVRAVLAGMRVVVGADPVAAVGTGRALAVVPAGADPLVAVELAAEGITAIPLDDDDAVARLAAAMSTRRAPSRPGSAPAADGDPDAWGVPAALEPLDASARAAVVPAPVATAGIAAAVVVAHHRHPDLLAHVLRSLEAQDHDALEVVVVDDGTPAGPELDRLHEVVAGPWTRPVRLVRQENRYLGAARNTGVAATTAAWVAFVDDDDVLEPSYVSRLLAAALATGAAAVTCTMATVADDDGGPLTGTPTGVVTFLGGAGAALGPIANVFGGAAGMVRRDAWAAVGGFHEEYGRGHEDWALYARLALAGHRVVSLPEPLYRYRIRAGSMIRSTAVWENMQPVFDAYRDQLPEALRDWPETLRRLGDQVADRDRSLTEARAELDAAARREGALRAEIDGLRAQQAAMQRSTTWRVGRLALSPLGTVRRVLRRVLR